MSSNEILVEFQDDFTIPFLTYHRILEKWWAKDWPLALALYIRYIEQVKRQGKNETWSLDKFMIKNSWLEKRKFYKIKKILVDMKLIEQIKGQWSDIKVRVNFVIHKEKTLGVAIDVPTESSQGAKNAPTETKKPIKAKVQKVHFSPGAEIAPQNNKEVDNININNDINKSKLILSKDNIEQSSDFSDLWNLKNWKNETQEEVNSLSQELKGPSGAGDEENEEFWNKEINAILKLLCKAVGIDEFKETQQRQRIYWKHFVNWIKNNWKQEFLNRLKWVLSDWFKAKNANSIAYLYHEIKSFIHSPVLTPVDTNKKHITFW